MLLFPVLQDRYASLERDYEVELLLKAEAQEAATAPAAAQAAASASAACAVLCSPAQHAPNRGPQLCAREAQVQLRASRHSLLPERRQRCDPPVEGSAVGDGAQRRHSPGPQSAEPVVSLQQACFTALLWGKSQGRACMLAGLVLLPVPQTSLPSAWK